MQYRSRLHDIYRPCILNYMPNNDPLRHLTRGLSEAVPHDPAFIAMTEGNGIIPSTLGDLASRLVEAGEVEPSLEAVCDYLLIEQSDLKDSTMVFTCEAEVQWFENKLTARYEESYKKTYGVLAKNDTEQLGSHQNRWQIENGEAKALALNEQIITASAGIDSLSEDEYWAKKTKLAIQCIERDSLQSGIAVGLEEFVGTVLSESDLEYFTPTEVASAVDSMLEQLVSKYSLDKEVPVSSLVIGEAQINVFLQALYLGFMNKIHLETRRRWSIITPYIYAGHIKKHPLVAGTEA